MDEGILEANVDQLLNHLEAVIEPQSQDLIGAREAADWCRRRYPALRVECDALPEDSPARPGLHRRLEEASRYLLILWCRPDQPRADDVEGR